MAAIDTLVSYFAGTATKEQAQTAIDAEARASGNTGNYFDQFGYYQTWEDANFYYGIDKPGGVTQSVSKIAPGIIQVTEGNFVSTGGLPSPATSDVKTMGMKAAKTAALPIIAIIIVVVVIYYLVKGR